MVCVWNGLGRRVLEPDGDVDLAGLGERIVTRVKVLAILNYSCLWFCKGGRGMCRIVRNQGPFMRLVEVEFGGQSNGRGGGRWSAYVRKTICLRCSSEQGYEQRKEPTLVATKRKKKVVKCAKVWSEVAPCGVMIMLETLGFFSHTLIVSPVERWQ